MMSAMLANGGRTGFINVLDTAYKAVILGIAAVGIYQFFFSKWRNYLSFLKQLARKLDISASKTTSLMDKILPRFLQGLEDKGIIPKNTLVE